jgi:hypothetical protein
MMKRTMTLIVVALLVVALGAYAGASGAVPPKRSLIGNALDEHPAEDVPLAEDDPRREATAVASDGEYDFNGIAAESMSANAVGVIDAVVPNGQVIYYEGANPDLDGWHHEQLSIATPKGSTGDVFTVWWQEYDPTWDVDRFLTDGATVETWPPNTRAITTARQTNIQIIMITDELIVSVIVEAAPKAELTTDEPQLVGIARSVLERVSNGVGE